MFAKLTQAQAAFLISLRDQPDDVRKPVKKELFAVVKATHGIPPEHKLKVEIDRPYDADYLVLKNKDSGHSYPLDPATGKWSGASVTTSTYQPPRSRWFPVATGSVYEQLREQVLFADEDSWDDGRTDAPDGTPLASAPNDLIVGSDGLIYIALTEGDFDV